MERFGKMRLAVCMALLPAAVALAEQEFGPIEIGEVVPIRGSKFDEPAPGARPDPVPQDRGNVTVRHWFPVDDNTRRVIKTEAVRNPAAQGADALGAEPLPLAPTISTSFVGLNIESAANNGFVFFPPDTISDACQWQTRIIKVSP